MHSNLIQQLSSYIPPSLCELLCKPDNEELMYTELLEVCDWVTLSVTEEEANLTSQKLSLVYAAYWSNYCFQNEVCLWY